MGVLVPAGLNEFCRGTAVVTGFVPVAAGATLPLFVGAGATLTTLWTGTPASFGSVFVFKLTPPLVDVVTVSFFLGAASVRVLFERVLLDIVDGWLLVLFAGVAAFCAEAPELLALCVTFAFVAGEEPSLLSTSGAVFRASGDALRAFAAVAAPAAVAAGATPCAEGAEVLLALAFVETSFCVLAAAAGAELLLDLEFVETSFCVLAAAAGAELLLDLAFVERSLCVLAASISSSILTVFDVGAIAAAPVLAVVCFLGTFIAGPNDEAVLFVSSNSFLGNSNLESATSVAVPFTAVVLGLAEGIRAGTFVGAAVSLPERSVVLLLVTSLEAKGTPLFVELSPTWAPLVALTVGDVFCFVFVSSTTGVDACALFLAKGAMLVVFAGAWLAGAAVRTVLVATFVAVSFFAMIFAAAAWFVFPLPFSAIFALLVPSSFLVIPFCFDVVSSFFCASSSELPRTSEIDHSSSGFPWTRTSRLSADLCSIWSRCIRTFAEQEWELWAPEQLLLVSPAGEAAAARVHWP
mmetsp:Transcript_95526/g.175043  ORF Transcript_95526/g.175043 Transcript_95526/m.175043 type:complete len:522 (-) Transcript_95526:8-1573(-)